MSQLAARSPTTRQRILAGCAEDEDEDDLAFLVLHWQETAELRLVYSIAPRDGSEEIGKIFCMEVEESHGKGQPVPWTSLCDWEWHCIGNPRAMVGVLRELLARPRSASYRDHLARMDSRPDPGPDNFAWLVEHWFDSSMPGVVYNIMGDRTEPYEVTNGEIFMTEVKDPEGNPRAGVGAMRRSCRLWEDRE